MKSINRNIVYSIAAVLFFLVLAYAFVPQVLGGKIVNQGDIYGYVGMSHEMNEHNAAHPGDPTAWTDSMFGGMPTTVISAPHQGDWTQPLYNILLTGKRPATYIFISLLGAFLLMLALGISPLVAVIGAVAVSFCSYNFQIIQVGHNTKMQAIAFLPWVLAALIFTYKSAVSKVGDTWKGWLPKTVLGSVLFALALSFQVKANHQQITYYLAILIFIYVAVLLVSLLRSGKKVLGRFLTASVLLLLVGGVGIATNMIKLAPVWEYTEYSTRGGSELKGPESSKAGGLDLSYATAWSYGWEELPNLMIPDFNGGSSAGAVDPDKSETIKLLKNSGQTNLKEISRSLPLYWGPQPFTAGPMYMGIITVFLFLMGLCLYKGKEKWWVVLATVLAVFLAVGSHFMWFTKAFSAIAPLYNKFRTVSMALVILQFTLPVLGFLWLDSFIRDDSADKKKVLSGMRIAGALTAGFCLVCAVFPGIVGTFSAPGDAGMEDILAKALAADRRALMVKDAWMGFILVMLAGATIIWWSESNGKVQARSKKNLAVAVIGILVLMNMFSVGKRYLNADHFITPRNFNGQFALRPVDKMILEDEALSYRTLDLSVNVFNDARSSYWHKEIGGYSPAKLQRYQDLIERHITPEINSFFHAAGEAKTISEAEEKLPYLPVISMLNGKYLILGGENPPVVNRNAFGNAWFVDSAVVAATPEEEISSLSDVNLHETAVLGHDFQRFREGIEAGTPAPGDTVFMTSYAANELHFHYKISSPRAVLFSEVYYPDGWHAWLADAPGKPQVEIFRADWILRGAILPEGEHDLVMRFDPTVYTKSAGVSRASSILLLFILVLSILGLAVLNNKQS